MKRPTSLVSLAISVLCPVAGSATVPDFQQALIPSEVLLKSDSSSGSGTIISADKEKGVQYLVILTADHVVQKGGVLGKQRTNLRIITNSKAGSLTLPVYLVNAGGATKKADMALAFVEYKDDKFDFSKVTALVGIYNGELNKPLNYVTEWGYGDTGKPNFGADDAWTGYVNAGNDLVLRFQNNVFNAKTTVNDREDGYSYDAFVYTLDRYSKDRPNWVNGEGASYPGDSGGGYFIASPEISTFILKTALNPASLYNGPAENVKDGMVQIPYFTNVVVGEHTLGIDSPNRVFNQSTGKGYLLTKADIDWMKNACRCKIDVVDSNAPQPMASRTPDRREDRVEFGLFLGLCSIATAVVGITLLGSRPR